MDDPPPAVDVNARDVLGRVAVRTASGVEASTVRYGFTGTDDSPDLLLTAGGAVVERYVSLPGGVLHRKGYAVGATGSWSVSNLHGDVIATVSGGVVTAGYVYDPFGQPLNPASGVVDTSAVPATRAGTGTTDGWAGVFQRGYEHTGGLSQTLMGARTYLPALGMFTATDPVAGGNTTTYTYPQDPINHADYTGTMLSDGPSGSTLNIPLSLPGWKPFNPTKPGKTGTSKTPKGDRRNIPGDNIYIPPRIDPMKYTNKPMEHLSEHFLFGFNVCAILCGGLSFQDAHPTASFGGVGFGGKGAYVGWNGSQAQQGVSVSGFAGGGYYVTASSSKNLEGDQRAEFDVGVGYGGGAWIGTMLNVTFW